MSLQIHDRSLEKIAIIDDAADVRQSYEDAIEDLDLEALPEPGPLPALDEYVRALVRRADAAVCDHQLTPGNYANYSGAELAMSLCCKKFPALLCTGWGDAKTDDIRSYRRYLPVVLTPKELNPDSLRDGLEQCFEEFAGSFRQERKPWRTLVRIEDVEATGRAPVLFVVVPAWDPRQVVSLYLRDLPGQLHARAACGVRLHAWVNLGAEHQGDLYFFDWEAE